MFIIDGYNCTYAGSAMGGAFDGFSVRRLCALLEKNQTAAIVVLDGRPKPAEPDENDFPGVKLIYSGRGVKADDVIRELLSRRTDRRRLTVVSNDRAVAADARRQKARSESCEKFLHGLLAGLGARKARRGGAEPPEKSAGLVNVGETEHWLREFGLNLPAATKRKPADELPAAEKPTVTKFSPISSRGQSVSGKPPGNATKNGILSRSKPRFSSATDLSELDDRAIAALLGPVDPQ